MSRDSRYLIILIMTLVLIFGVFGCGQKAEPPKENAPQNAEENNDPMNYKGKISIGAQTVNESIILAHIAKLLVEEYTGLEVETSTEFAGSSVLHQAMVEKELDIYPTWTGTQLTGILRYEGPNLSKEESYRMVKEGFEEKFKFTWAKPLGFNNTYVMTVRRDTAEKHNLEKASDLKEQAPNWVLGGDNNFDTRPDAYPGWAEAYGIKFKDVTPMEYSLMYHAIANKQLDVICAYSTDSRIKKLDLVMLEDDKEFFPDYSAAYVVRMDTLEKYPKVLEIIEKVSGQIDEETMAGLNYIFDEGGDPEVIAKDFLTEKGLLK
ncbi:MAG: glycine betaine ABC transporter substrate-binding protein [Bacillota bacterium]